MRRKSKVLVLGCVLLATAVLLAQHKHFKELLIGYEEVPAVSTSAWGDFRLNIARDKTSFEYKLSYTPLESAVTQAHIHFGQKGVNGGISVWLCSNLASPPTPAGVQPCPTPSGTISGTVTAANVVGPSGQGITAGQFAELIEAMQNRMTYVNVHSANFGGGEIRSQIDPGPR
ncbi:MAG: CHRD domain-containing protein [Candidatus Korobacteraceae bacterium]